MQMAAGMDTGPMYLKAVCPIEQNDTAQVLHDKLAVLGAATLLETIGILSDGSAKLEDQDESLVTYAAKITKEEAAINWQESAIVIQRKICAFNPAPVCHTELFEKKVRVWEAEVIDSHTDRKAGEIVKATREGIDVATGEGLLRIKILQMPGKRQITVADFVNGNAALLADFIT
jgi:methionyl-tRNA formyltransferase